MTINDVYISFLKSGKAHWAVKTQAYYEKNVGYFLSYLKKRYKTESNLLELSELPATILVEYVIWLRARQRYSDHPLRNCMNVNGQIKCNTVNTYMRATKAFFNYAYQSNLTTVRYTEGLRLPRPDDDQIIPLLASEAVKMDSIFDRSTANDLRNLCIVHLMLDAGLRSREVISLRPGDIIFASHTIVINRSKGNKSRVVIMCPSLEKMLLEYFDIFKPSGTVFIKTTENKAINESVMRSLFLRIVRITGIDRLHPHLLRHTFATSYIMGGGNLETLRILMGHSDYNVTRKYLHLASQNQILGSDIYKLDSVFFKKAY